LSGKGSAGPTLGRGISLKKKFWAEVEPHAAVQIGNMRGWEGQKGGRIWLVEGEGRGERSVLANN